MRERSEQIFKVVCLSLGVLLAVQLVKAVLHLNPLAGLTIPDLPSLPAETNAVASVTNKPPAKGSANTNISTAAAKTTASAISPDTNLLARTKPKETGSNSPSTQPAVAAATLTRNQTATNTTLASLVNTNAAKTNVEASTNSLAGNAVNTNRTPEASAKKHSRQNGDLPPGMMAGVAGSKGAKLPPEIQARVDRVTESEILGPVIHPMPMALLGIAGNVAFLRSPGGQTGLVKEGEDLGEIKLLRIGTNRVLVEQNGEKKELMIFAGLGGESLLPKSTEPTNETTNRN